MAVKSDVRLEDNAKVENVYKDTTVNNYYGNVDVASKPVDYDEAKLKEMLDRYLENAYKRYNKVKTLATGNTPRNVIGNNSVYVNVGVKRARPYDYNFSDRDKSDDDNETEDNEEDSESEKISDEEYEKKISTVNVDRMLKISKNILIIGTGGAGKSMLMRYLFLKTKKDNKELIPVFVRLNKMSEQTEDNISIFDLVFASLKELGADINKETFEYSLRQGKYLFLLDGFDEIKESHSKKAAEDIQIFCSNYSDNPCIITSRPSSNTSPFETFTVLKMLDLNLAQAKRIIRKIGEKDEKKDAFLKELEEKLFEYPYRSFTVNPLLLSMMFLTFRRNNSVSDRMADFYSKAYEALYNLHDSTDKGAYKREFKSNLDEQQFKNVFAHFCFQTYMAEKYNFSEEEIVSFIEKSLIKCGAEKSQAKNYCDDLKESVCLIVKEGTDYVFAHRSFQTYFAALYTEKMDDEKQKQLFDNLLSREAYYYKKNYYKILIQLMGERFVVNALEDKLRSLKLNPPYADDFMLKIIKNIKLITKIIGHRIGIGGTLNGNLYQNCFSLIKLYFKVYKKNVLYECFAEFSSREKEERIKKLYKKF